MAESQLLGLALPTPSYLAGLVVFGIVGYIAWRRGRRTGRPALTWIGLGTMLYPYIVPQTWLLWLIGFAATGWIWFEWG